MGRDDDIAAILESGRRTRRRTPRGLWIAAIIVGVACAGGFAIAMLAPRASVARLYEHGDVVGRGPGLGLGLMIGVAVGIAIGIAIERQRSHSSRSSP